MAGVRITVCLFLLVALSAVHGRQLADDDQGSDDGHHHAMDAQKDAADAGWEDYSRLQESVDADNDRSQAVSKRTSLDFVHMTNVLRGGYGRNIFSNALYLRYGCYCGLGVTSTKKPVDDVDACCKVHDGCWDANRARGCGSGAIGFYRYSFRNSNRDVKCHSPQWYDLYGGCGKRYCECDRAAALCLSRVHDPRASNFNNCP